MTSYYGRYYLVLSFLAKDILAPTFHIAALAQLKVLLVMIIVIRWQWGHTRPGSWASKWCQYGRRVQSQSPQTEEQWYCLARFVTSSKHWSILEYFTIIEHWSLAGWKLEHWVQISLTITWRAPGSDDVHGGADYHLERFTKIPRVELSVADNVVDWTILKQSRILIILSDHHHNHK